MITVANINGSPESVPSVSCGVYSDANSFYFFESEQEKTDFLAALPVVWDKEAYCAQITAEIDALILAAINEYDYERLSEVVAENYAGGVWQSEALAILQWKTDLWVIRNGYFEALTEQNVNDSFIDSLPLLVIED